jgi:hypothetical protein
MAGNGVSKVISRRLPPAADEAAPPAESGGRPAGSPAAAA